MPRRSAVTYPLVVDAKDRVPLLGLRPVWHSRDLVRLMAGRDVKLRFRQTRFGVLWLIVMPLFFSVGYAFLFGTIGNVSSEGQNHFVFTYVGISLWTAFSTVFGRTCNCLLGNRELLTHAYFPRLSVPFASAFATQVDVAISWVIVLLCLVLSGQPLRPGLLLLPVWFFVAQVIACALGLMVASWTIAFRDLQHITSVVLAVGPIFTPVAYLPTALPENFRWLATVNPLTPLFNGVRASAFGSDWPSLISLAFTVATMLVLVLMATAIFGRAERRLADVI